MKKKLTLIITIFIIVTGITYGQSQLWGVTFAGGANDAGTIFAINPDGSNFTTYYSFASPTGAFPSTNLVKANNNKFYGVTHYEGPNFFGVIYSYDPFTNTYVDILDFDGINGGGPDCKLLLATDGNLYGTTNVGGSAGSGVLFRLNPNTNAYTILKDFNNVTVEGGFPIGSLVQATNGLIYGTGNSGGINSDGTIFSYNISTSTFTKLKDCNSGNVRNPVDGLMQASDGKLYGTASNNGAGSVFSYDIVNNVITNILNLGTGGINAPSSRGTLAEVNGKLYGLTSSDINSPAIEGDIFSIDIYNNNAYAEVFHFNASGTAYPDGKTPYGHLTKGSDNKLYGMTAYGGSADRGVAFRFDPSGNTFTRLHDFVGGINEGSHPAAEFTEVAPPPCLVPPLKPGAISVGGGSGGVCPGDSRQYSVTSVPGVVYDWEAPAGAVITSGQGTALINVTFTAGFTSSGNLFVRASNPCGHSGKQKLTITKNPVPAKPGAISGASPVCVGTTNTYSVSPVPSATSYIWTVPAGAIIIGPANGASVNVYFSAGGGNITVKASSNCGTSAARSRFITVSCRLGEEDEITDVSKAEVFPNPAHDHITVKFVSNGNEKYSVSLIDITGRMLLEESDITKEGVNLHQIDISGYPKGIYMMSIQRGSHIQYLKIIAE
jgi:uncharacterized repeat protein (TIGR03803 family)